MPAFAEQAQAISNKGVNRATSCALCEHVLATPFSNPFSIMNCLSVYDRTTVYDRTNHIYMVYFYRFDQFLSLLTRKRNSFG